MNQSLLNAMPPPYRLRVSPRARRARVQVTPLGEVEVVIPRHFDPDCVPDLLLHHAEWIRRVQDRIQSRRYINVQNDEGLPAEVILPGDDRLYQVSYEYAARSVCRRKRSGYLQVTAPTEDEMRKAMLKWLTREAKSILAPRLAMLAEHHDLPFERLSVRGQRRRWGSCSSKHSICLNRCLVFLQPELMDYVMMHELCHTVHLNHSRAFWRLVESRVPGYRTLDRELRYGWSYVPRWAFPD